MSPPTSLRQSEGRAEVELADVVDGARYVQRFEVDRASVCFECGHVMLCIGAKALARLRHRAGTLTAIAEE